MRYTTLLVTDAGVVLFERHLQRLAPEGAAAALAFRRFAGSAAPGTYALRADGDRLDVQLRPGSRLHDGMPARWRVSPVAHLRGLQPKAPSPCVYDPVREPGVATLLTTADGAEVLEACVAAVVGWDGSHLVLAPPDRPRVDSVSEQAIRAALPFVEAPLRADAALPLALVNAVKGPCTVALPGRPPFPELAASSLRALFAHETRR
jgi:hypothetical protein